MDLNKEQNFRIWEEAVKLKAYLDGTVKVCEAENRVEPELALLWLAPV